MFSYEVLAVLMLVSFFILLLSGIPVALTLAISGFVFGYLGFGSLLFNLLPHRLFGVVTNSTLLAIPLFVFMGMMLERSRLAEDLMDVIGHLAGALRGGLGIGIVLVGVLMGATTGIVGATVVTLGLLTLPGMLRRGYNKGLACGVICASGTLGQIIPPSLILILLADLMNESVGTLFAAAMIPGLMLAGISCVYILVLGILRPQDVPAIPAEERALLSGSQLAMKLLKVVAPPVGLVGAVLGSIIAGIAAPSEAASMGALGSIAIAGVTGRLSLRVLRETCQATIKIAAMMMFILDVRSGVRAGVPRSSRRRFGEGLLRAAAGRHQRRHLVPDAHHLHPRLLHRVDRDFLHRGAAVPAGIRGGERGAWCGSPR